MESFSENVYSHIWLIVTNDTKSSLKLHSNITLHLLYTRVMAHSLVS